jgi:hypothetical protein
MDHQKRSPYASWITSSKQTGPEFRGGLKLDLGLHLGDSKRISFGPPSRFGCPCWSPWPPCNSPSMVMTSSPTSQHLSVKNLQMSATIWAYCPHFHFATMIVISWVAASSGGNCHESWGTHKHSIHTRLSLQVAWRTTCTIYVTRNH